MAWCLFGAKPLPETVLAYCQLVPSIGNKLELNIYQNSDIFIQEKAWNMAAILYQSHCVNSLRPRQNGRHLADDMFKCIFLNENVWIPIAISLKFVPKVPINNIPALVQIMAWRQPGDKPLSQPMLVRLPTHICVTRPQWVNHWQPYSCKCLHTSIQLM